MSTDNLNPEAGVEIEETTELSGVEESQDVSSEANNEEASAESADDSKAKDDNLPIGVQKRFAALTRQKYDMQRELEQMRQEMAQLRSRHQEPEKTRDDFLDDQDWIDYRAAQQAQKLFVQQQKAQYEQFQQSQRVQQEAQVWQSKVEQMKQEMPDFAEVVSSSPITIPDAAMDFIKESDIGPKIAYHLAKHPDEAEGLWNLSERALDRKLMKMEIKMESTPAQSSSKPVSQAPAPVKQSKGTSGVVNEDALSIDEWMKRRTKQVRG